MATNPPYLGPKAAAHFLQPIQDILAKGKRPARADAQAAIEALLRVVVDLSDSRRQAVVLALRRALAAEDLVKTLAGEPEMWSESALLELAQTEGEAKQLIYRQPMLSASAVGTLLGTSASSNRRKYANTLRQQSKILGLPSKNSYVYPAFQLHAARRCLHQPVTEVNRRMDALRDPFGVASWWLTPSERLGGRAPFELLGTADEPLVLDLVEADIAPLG